MLRASCLKLEINELACYEAKKEESEKAGNHRESNPGHLWLTPNRVLTAHTEWLSGVRLRHFSTTCAVYIEDCEGWWLSGCRGSVEEHWWLNPEVS